MYVEDDHLYLFNFLKIILILTSHNYRDCKMAKWGVWVVGIDRPLNILHFRIIFTDNRLKCLDPQKISISWHCPFKRSRRIAEPKPATSISVLTYYATVPLEMRRGERVRAGRGLSKSFYCCTGYTLYSILHNSYCSPMNKNNGHLACNSNCRQINVPVIYPSSE